MRRPGAIPKLLTATLAVALSSPALADDPQAREDTWWQAEGRDRSAYLEAGIEVTVDDGNLAGAVGEAGNVELTTGYWLVPFAAAEIQLAVGRAINPGVLPDTRVASTTGGVGAGLRLALPIRVSPILAAHVGYRQVLAERAELTCGAECATRVPVALDAVPDQQIYGDAEVGVQLNLGTFSMTATFEYSRPFVENQTTEVMTRGNPQAATADLDDPARAAEYALNLQAGVRF